MENKNPKETVEYDPHGKPRENAWFWLFKNRGMVALFYWIAPIGLIMTWGDTLGMIVCSFFTIVIPTLCIVHDIKWYKLLVKEKLIKTFAHSKFFSKI